jgi:uncharacterized FAD-dependent dehydrogenase
VLNLNVCRPGEDAPPLWSAPNYIESLKLESEQRPVIVGAGPAGLFAAIRFLEHGIAPIVLERGQAVEQRGKDIAQFKREGILDGESNYCFGEGGAGTFSDGKLYTRKHHPLVRTVLEWLVSFGAPEMETLVDARPHVGSNQLIPLLQRLRNELQEHGVTFHFGKALSRIETLEVAGSQTVRAIHCADGEVFPCTRVILATGHSARDIYEHLDALGVVMEAKPMAIGSRIEHPQSLIDRAQFGSFAGTKGLGAATYRLACSVEERGVYSFCMCPGGFVIPTPSSPGRLNVNGMSNSNRGGAFANSAVVVSVTPADYAAHSGRQEAHPLDGVRFQDALEQACFEAGGSTYKAPAQRLPDLLKRRSGDLPEKTSYRPGLVASDLNLILPTDLQASFHEGIRVFGRKLKGFDSNQAVAIGLETTTSAPLRVLRDDTSLESLNLKGLYPCGEGAGFAGGIISSAIDGIRVADAVAGTLSST